MGLFKKRYDKNVSRDNEFLKEYAVRMNGLMIYVEDNEKVAKELAALRDDFQYTVATDDKHAKAYEKKIDKDYKELSNLLQQPQWPEADVIMLIRGMRRYIVEINALR